MSDEKEQPADADSLRRSVMSALRFWAIRWTLGFAGAIAIVWSTGKYVWILWAAAAVAGTSLVMILLSARKARADMERGKSGDGADGHRTD